MAQPSLVTIRQAAEQLGDVTERWVRILVSRGELDAVRVGTRALRVKQSSIDSFIERNTLPTIGRY